MTRDTILLYFALKYDGDFNKIYHAIDTNERIDFANFNKLMSTVKYKYITIVDPRYPNYLKDKYNPPIVLY